MWLEDRCHAAESTLVMDEGPFLVADHDRVAGFEVGAGVAQDHFVIPSAVVVLGATTNGAGGAAAGLREPAHHSGPQCC